MNLEEIKLRKITITKRTNTVLFRLYEICRDRKWNGDFQGLGGGENGELEFNGYRVSAWEDAKISGDK